jgi:oligopeptide transport system substrate-binding protein
MSKPARIAFLVFLWLCLSLLIHRPFGSAATVGPPELHLPGAKFGEMYRRVLDNNPSTLDPAFLTDIHGRVVASQVFDGLVQFDAHLNPRPAIAEFWKASRDGRTWTFTLRRGVTFHHGREVTAHDVVYSFTRLLGLNRTVTATEIFRNIQGTTEFMQGKTTSMQGLKALDRYTPQMVLEEPLAPFVAALGHHNAAL